MKWKPWIEMKKSNEAAQPQRSSYGREIECNPDTPFSGVCIRGTKGCDVIHPEAGAASSEPPQGKPTIAELEALLDEKVERHIEINPDGSLRVTRPSSEPPRQGGEWTPGYVEQLFYSDGHSSGYKCVADAHNAALAAERQFTWDAVADVQKQLAASTGAAEEFFRTNGFLTQQLAAEREKFRQMDEAHVTAEKELASQLLQAQAAIDDHPIEWGECDGKLDIDAAALREHDAALLKEHALRESQRDLMSKMKIAQIEPLVEALKKARIKVVSLSPSDFKLQWLDEIDAALAQVKETSGTNIA